ncbi:MAG: hypothetical protein ABIP42_07995, partial [Planctomycetota bacterium]
MTSPVPTRSRRVVVLLALLVVALTLAFHRQFFSGDALIYGFDSAQLHYPRYRILCDSLQEDHALPLWQNLLYGGAPFHASPENPTLYPLVLLFASLCSPVWTINLMIVVHLAVGGLGMYFLILCVWRRIAQRETDEIAAGGACVGATIFALNFFTRQNHIDYVSYGAAVALGPWLLLATEAMLHGERPRRAAGWLAILIALEVFTGGIFVIPYTLLALGLWIFFQGLLGGKEQRRRSLTWGVLALGLAGAIVMAKYLPYREWAETTNRPGRLSYGNARAGPVVTDWGETWKRVRWATGGGWSLLALLLALPLLRHGVVRLLFAATLFFFLVYAGGPVHRFLYDWVPPFDRVRNVLRAWAGVNLLYPIAAGLGVCWGLSRLRWKAGSRLPAWIGAALAILLSPLLAFSYRAERIVQDPTRFSELVTRYTQWPEAARRCGQDWRAVYFDKREPDGRNEQFITTALGVETVAGYLGHVWPVPLEQHIYGPEDARLAPGLRQRRLGTLSVRWLVFGDASIPPAPRAADIYPPGVDGTTLLENPYARPRAMAPGAVIGVCGDLDQRVSYALLDDPRFPIREASVIRFDAPSAISPQESSSLDAIVVVGGDEEIGVETAMSSSQAVSVIGVHSPLTDEDRARIADLAKLVADKIARSPAQPALFARESSGVARVELQADQAPAGGRFVVLSEPWSWYPGWTAQGVGEDAPLEIRQADGICSAVLLPI